MDWGQIHTMSCSKSGMICMLHCRYYLCVSLSVRCMSDPSSFLVYVHGPVPYSCIVRIYLCALSPHPSLVDTERKYHERAGRCLGSHATGEEHPVS